MTKKYTYLNGAKVGKCLVEGCSKHTCYRFLEHSYTDMHEQHEAVHICPEHQEKLKAIVLLRNDFQLRYQINSGWPKSPLWNCNLVYNKNVGEVRHLHTTQEDGDAPSVFSGKISGLIFKTGNGDFPIEARNGKIIRIQYVDDKSTESEISIEEAIRLFKKHQKRNKS